LIGGTRSAECKVEEHFAARLGVAGDPMERRRQHERHPYKPSETMIMAIFNKDIIDLTNKNEFWQKEVFRDAKVQIVMMNIPTGEEIGMETHPADQTTFFVSGEGQAVVDGQSTKVGPNHLIVIPKGAEHNILNKGSGALKLYSVYAPPAEPEGAAFKTKEEAEEAEKGLLAKAADKAKEALGR
jgi:mannose-6-phosphate isomerase-like protein (cupin superfamily)